MEKKDWKHLIVRNPKIFSGEPIIKGTRIPIAFIFGQMSRNGGTVRGVQKVYPQLTREQIEAVLDYAKSPIRLPIHESSENEKKRVSC